MVFSFDMDIFLESSRVKLSPLQSTDFAHLLPISRAYPDLLDLSPSKFGTDEDLEKYIEIALAQRAANTRYPFIIFDKTTQEYAGVTSFGNVSNKDKRIEIGWTWIGKNYQRTGLNRACKFLLLQYAFETLEFARLELKTDARNAQSRKGMEGIGAKYEGCLRSHTIMSDGHRRDTVYYGILKSEWPEIKLSIFSGYN